MKKKYLLAIITTLIMLTTIAYSALAESLSITSEVKIRPIDEIRVTGITLNKVTNGRINYESDYSKRSITSGFQLNNSETSEITYNVTVENSGDYDYTIYSITNETVATGLTHTLGNYTIKEIIP